MTALGAPVLGPAMLVLIATPEDESNVTRGGRKSVYIREREGEEEQKARTRDKVSPC